MSSMISIVLRMISVFLLGCLCLFLLLLLFLFLLV